MQSYKITLTVDGSEHADTWSGYGEQSAIAQAMLYYAQNGARSIAITSIIL